MTRLGKSLISLMVIAGAWAADKQDTKFSPGPANSYPNLQTNDGVTIAAVPYETKEKAREAFDKLNPYEHGLLPILLVVQNDSKEAVKLDQIRVELIGPDRSRIEATPAKDVPYLNSPDRPKVSASPLPQLRKKKNPLAAWEIEGRAFAAKMLPPGESAHGFFYFQTGLRRGSTVYITGLQHAGSGKEIFYFEIPIK